MWVQGSRRHDGRLRKLIEERLPEVDMGGAGDRGRQLDQLHQSQLTPLSGNRRRSTEMPCVLHAQAINLGLTGMACAREFTYQQLEWAREQYCREQVLTAASAGPEGERRGATARRART